MTSNTSVPSNSFHWTANWITIARVLFVIPMIYFYLQGDLQWGGICFIASIVPDWFDGPFARWQSRRYGTMLTPEDEHRLSYWQRINYPGQTTLGAMLDPLFDKVTNGLGLLLAGWNFIPLWLVGCVIGIDLVLQFVVRPLKSHYKIGSIKATDWGKYKTQCQGWCAGFMPFWQIWHWPYADLVFTLWLTFCIGFGLMSLRSHLIPMLRWWRNGTGMTIDR